jgi:phenylacetate-coenzyme A ligase PaaK-like adenylate-forming protein
MIESALAQLRVALSIGFGRPLSTRALERMVEGLKASQREFGIVARSLEVMGPAMDVETINEVHARRMRQVARLAAAETPYYAELFARLGLNPQRLSAEDLLRIPLTPKDAIRDRPDDFIRRGAQPFLRPTTTGTTGKPTSVAFSLAEIRNYAALQAIDALAGGSLRADDILQIATASRGLLGNVTLSGACAHVGTLVTMTGIVDPAYALAQLAEERHIPGKRPKVSVLYTYPSYMSELVETGLRLGYGPADFGLRSISIGGEIVTESAVRRAQALFGDLPITRGYGMTEIWPLGGTRCEAGHLHFQPSYGKVELLALDSDEPAAPGEAGRIVATPFVPFRETTLLLRFDTQDIARALPEPPTCSMRHLPATSDLLGKLKHAIRVGDAQWVFSKSILEAVESVAEVALPAQVGWEAAEGGVAIRVVVREDCDRAGARRALLSALAGEGVPVAALELCDGPHLPGAFPWRANQREVTL